MSDNSVAANQLRSLVERIERIEEEIAACNSDKRDIYAEAKGNGFDVAVLKQVVKIRKQDTNERMEREAILELYLNALGMSGTVRDETDDRAHARAPARTRENIEEFDADGVEIEPVSAPQHGAGAAPSLPAAPATTSVEQADESQDPAPHATSERPATVSRSGGEGGMVREARTEATAVTAGETATIVTREHGILRLRPNCQEPSACKSSGGRNHCFACRKAAEGKAGAA